jgi:hypothetical protein
VTEENWPLIEATLMTSQAIEAYGGVRFSREALEMGAASLNAGNVPMQADHNQTKPVRVRNLRAWVDDGADGFYRLKLSYEIHPEDAHIVANRRGMSAAMRAPIDGREDLGEVQTAIDLSADHAWFDDDALLAAESLVIAGGLLRTDIRTERVYQFSFVPDPQIFVTVVLPFAGVIATGALGSALWDAVKLLFQRRRTPPNGDAHKPTRVNLRLEDGGRSLSGIVETQDETVANRAIDAFEGLAREFMATPSSPEAAADPSDRRLLVWDDTAAAWLPHSPAQTEQPLPPVELDE